jgi:hypothetical protein
MNRPTLYERLRFRLQYNVADPVVRRVVEPARRWRNASRDYRPIFVAGAMGSGTSLLAVALGQRFDVTGVVYESARQISQHSFLYVPPLSEFASIAEYRASISPASEWAFEEGRHALLALYRAHGVGSGEWIVDKGPNTNLLRADFLARCFPNAAWLLLYRDPVATVEGFRRKWKTFGRESVEANARFWVDVYESGLRQLDALGRDVSVVEYGSLAERTDDVLEDLGEHLRLARARRLRRLRSRVDVEGLGIRNVSNNRIGVVRAADAKAVARVPADDARVIREICEPTLAMLAARTTLTERDPQHSQ